MARLRARDVADVASTCANSSSATTRRTKATARSCRARPTRTRGTLADSCSRCSRRSAKRASSTSRRCPSGILAHAPGYIDKDERDHRRPADRCAAQARDHAVRRLARGRERASRPTATSPTRALGEIFTKYRKTHNDGVFDAYTPDIRKARVVAHRHRPARCLRPRPHHRRLSPGGAVRRGFPDRRQEAREGRARRPPFDRGRDPPARGACRADPLAARS